MRICILNVSPESWDTEEPDSDRSPCREQGEDWPVDPVPFLRAHETRTVLLRRYDTVPTVTPLAGEGWDLFFDLCDGAWDDPSPGIEVVQALERLNVRFPGDSFKHSDLKWVDYHTMKDVPVTAPELDGRLRRLSRDFFLAMPGVSFGRCDLRMGRDGTLSMLEVNPDFALYHPASDPGSADLSLLHNRRSHQGFTDLILESALARHARRQRS